MIAFDQTAHRTIGFETINRYAYRNTGLTHVASRTIGNGLRPTKAGLGERIIEGGRAFAHEMGKDFSFLGTILKWAGLVAIVLIICSAIFGFTLGIIFSVAMVGFAGAAILYDASEVIHHYPEDRYVGAALQLFASVALMFWYVLRIFISRD